MTRWRSGPARPIAISLLAIVAFAGCSLFTTRTPEPPISSGAFVWTPATTVTDLITNFTGTLTQLDAQNYQRTMVSETDSTGSASKTFVFTPAAGVDQATRAIFTGWTPHAEQLWLSNLSRQLPSASRLIVNLSNVKLDQSTVPATYSADYIISIPAPATQSIIPSAVQGSLQFQLIFVTTDQGTKEWRISTWSDFASKTGSGPTWTELKAKLSS